MTREVGRRSFLSGCTGLAATAGLGACRARGPTVPVVPGVALDPAREVTTVAFGSCCEQHRPAPIWKTIAAQRPDVFVFMGDNVYANAEEERGLVEAYQMLAESSGYAELRADVPVVATWDDHDFGRDDAGAEYPLKDASQRVMLDFFGEPADSPRRRQQGVYTSYVLGPPGRRLQIVLLDTRYFRSEVLPLPGRGAYRPNPDPKATILGPTQWAWLETVLREPAQLRLLVSSIQVVSDDHPYERWGNFPRERARLLQLLGRVEDLLVVSGDRHRAEISAMPLAGRTLVEVTSSSLNMPREGNEPNRHRVGELLAIANYGTLAIDWVAGRAQAEVRDERGIARLSYEVHFTPAL